MGTVAAARTGASSDGVNLRFGGGEMRGSNYNSSRWGVWQGVRVGEVEPQAGTLETRHPADGSR